MKKYTHLGQEERDLIYLRLGEGKTQEDIAQDLGRDPGTISRERNRNATVLSSNLNGLKEKKKEHYHYLPDTAEKKSKERRRKANWRSPLKSPEILEYVIEKLKQGRSPDIISGSLKLLYGEDTSMLVSHETIYEFIYSKKGEELKLKYFLVRAHKKRRKKTGMSVHKVSKIPNRVDISVRPKEVESRKEFGHFEGDSVLSVRSTHSALRTEVERKSRFLMVKKIERKTAEYTLNASISLYGGLPPGSVKSITWDNGSEHVSHEQLTQQLNIPVYFAEPYKSRQRGSNEHANGMIRRFFPKGTNFDLVSDEEIQTVVTYLNNRPRKILGYKTPQQIFDLYISTFT